MAAVFKLYIKWAIKGLAMLILGLNCAANAECLEENELCIATDSWQASVALGAGAISNPLNGGSTIPLFILPSISYYGEQFYLENTEVGYTLSENNHYAFSLTAGLNSEAAYFYRWHPSNIFTPSSYQGSTYVLSTSEELQGQSSEQNDEQPPEAEVPAIEPEQDSSTPSISINEVQERKWAADGGARLHWFTDWGVWQLQGVTDISDTYNGYQLNLTYQQQFNFQHWTNVLTLGGSYKSENLVDYYYGVDAQDSSDSRVYYQGKGSFNPYFRWFGNTEINSDWNLIYWFGAQYLGEGISDSPLVSNNTSFNAFIGFSYKVL